MSKVGREIPNKTIKAMSLYGIKADILTAVIKCRLILKKGGVQLVLWTDIKLRFLSTLAFA